MYLDLYQCNVLVVRFFDAFITIFTVMKDFLESRISNILTWILEYDLKNLCIA